MVKLSIIVPVYNVAPYLRECLNSIICQKYDNWEMILVDDGSTDESPQICEEYGKQNSQIKIIHKENGGLSDARNYGTKMAIGEYIIYIDSDDFLADEDCLSRLVSEVEKTPECDFIGYNVSYYRDGNLYPWREYPEDVSQIKSGADSVPFLIKTGTFPMSACSKIIKRNFIIDNNLWFIKGIYSEDIPWFVNLLKAATKCRYINDYIYCYRKGNAQSISSSFSKKKFEDQFNILENGVNSMPEWNESSWRGLMSYWAYDYCILRGNLYDMPDVERKNWGKKLDSYRWLMKYDLNPKVRRVKCVQSIVGWRITDYLLNYYIAHFKR